VQADRRVDRYYDHYDEAGRLWRAGTGDLVRLRTWDIFDRLLPRGGRIADVGGGPGTHAARLVQVGHEVVLVDPVAHHVEQARAATGGAASCHLADARALPFADGTFDAVLLMGPLYHLTDAADRRLALHEAHRVLKPGGRLLCEVITRHAWLLDATRKGLLHDADVRASIAATLDTGLSTTPSELREGGFWAYFHDVDEIVPEVEAAGFVDSVRLGVEGFAWLLGDLAEQLADPQHLLELLRVVESDPSLLGVSAHVIAIATRP
jgi:SAM-dependent methyltransferase